MITSGDIDDRNTLGYKVFMKSIYGKLVGDKGNIGKNLFKKLYNSISTAKVRYHKVTSYDDLLDEMSKLH